MGRDLAQWSGGSLASMTRAVVACVLLVSGTLGASVARADEESLGIGLEVAYMRDDNVARASDDWDYNLLKDNVLSLAVNKVFRFPLGTNTRLIAVGELGANDYNEYSGLSNRYVSASGQLQYRPSGAFGAPTYGLQVKVARDEYDSEVRDGYRSTVSLSVRSALTDRIDASVALFRNVRDGKSVVFDTAETGLRINVDYAATRRDFLYLTLDGRYGEIVSTAKPSLKYVDYSVAIVPDDAFPDGRYAYKLKDATTVIFTLGYNRMLVEGHSLDLSFRTVRSSADGGLDYTTNQLTLAYLARF